MKRHKLSPTSQEHHLIDDMFIVRRLELRKTDKQLNDKQIISQCEENITVVYTNNCGYINKVQSVGTIEYLYQLYTLDKAIIRKIHSYGGMRLNVLHDSSIFIFKETKRALKSFLKIFQIINEYNANVDDIFKLSMRVGISCGNVINVGNKVYGDPEIEAYNLCHKLAAPGRILVSEKIYSELNTEFSMSKVIDGVYLVNKYEC